MIKRAPEIKTLLINTLKKNYLIILICLLAFAIRLIGINFGYPMLVHTDEPTIINSVFYLTENRTLDPGHYERPDLILIYLNFLVLNIISYLRFGMSIAHSFIGHEFQFYLYARIINAIIGSAIPIVAYKIGKQFNGNFAIPAAILFAVLPSYTIHSHYVTPEITATLLTLLVMLFSIYYLKNENRKLLIIASIIAAINTAEKYPGILSLGIIFAAITVKEFSGNRRLFKYVIFDAFKEWLYVFFIFFCALYLIAPILFINFGQVFNALIYETRPTHLGADNLGWLGNLVFYVQEYSAQTPMILWIFFCVGIYASFKKKILTCIPLLYGFIYWIILSKMALHWERWAVPMYTFPLIFTAFGYQFLHSSLKNKYLRISFSVLFYFGCGLLLLQSISSSIVLTFRDTRLLALQYCDLNKITPDNSIFEAYSPFTPVGGGNILFDFDLISSRQYVILSSNIYGRYFQEPDRYKNEITIYQKIRQQFKLLKEFSPNISFPISYSVPFSSKPQNIGYWFDNIFYFVQRVFGVQNSTEKINGPTIQIFEVTK